MCRLLTRAPAPAPPAALSPAEAERTPVWLMRQAGRYMADFRKYSDRIPFRERSETSSIAIELSLQPFRSFQTDGVIMFSDILTPLPALGIEFDVIKGKGPLISNPINRCEGCGARRDGYARLAQQLLAAVAAVLRPLCCLPVSLVHTRLTHPLCNPTAPPCLPAAWRTCVRCCRWTTRWPSCPLCTRR